MTKKATQRYPDPKESPDGTAAQAASRREEKSTRRKARTGTKTKWTATGASETHAVAIVRGGVSPMGRPQEEAVELALKERECLQVVDQEGNPLIPQDRPLTQEEENRRFGISILLAHYAIEVAERDDTTADIIKTVLPVLGDEQHNDLVEFALLNLLESQRGQLFRVGKDPGEDLAGVMALKESLEANTAVRVTVLAPNGMEIHSHAEKAEREIGRVYPTEAS